MLSLLRNKLRKLLAPPKERYATSRLRPKLERLEDRAMLSASSNSMSHAHGNGNGNGNGNAYGHNKGGGTQFVEQPAYTSSPHQSTDSIGRQSRSSSQQPDFAPAFGGIQDRQPPARGGSFNEPPQHASGFQDPPQFAGALQDPGSYGGFYDSPSVQDKFAQARQPSYTFQEPPQFVDTFPDRGSYSGGFYDPPVQKAVAALPRQPSYDTALSYEPVWEQSVFIVAPDYHQVVSDRPPLAQPEYRMPSTSVSSPPPVERIVYVIVVERSATSFLPAKSMAETRSSEPALVQLQHYTVPSANGFLAMASAVTNNASNILPAATTEQFVVHDGSTAAILAATARDLVFKDYTPNLLLLSSSTSTDRSNIALVNSEARQTDALDGFILPYQTSFLDEIAGSADAVSQEREAVNAVLEQLQDVDAPQSSSSPGREDAIAGEANKDLELRLDLLDAETVVNEMPVGEIQGGMVLLPSTGDANESKFDLTPVYAQHVESPAAPSVEASVGLFQAVDVMADDSTNSESAQPADSVLPHNEVLLNDPTPTERAQPTSRKAAALLGAAAMTGAMVWMRRGSGQHDASETTVPKRRRSRAASSH
jgi:hypothetical protein